MYGNSIQVFWLKYLERFAKLSFLIIFDEKIFGITSLNFTHEDDQKSAAPITHVRSQVKFGISRDI